MTATATSTQLLVIDADAHVIETERTWDYLGPAEHSFRPRLFASPDEPGQQYWVIENKTWLYIISRRSNRKPKAYFGARPPVWSVDLSVTTSQCPADDRLFQKKRDYRSIRRTGSCYCIGFSSLWG